ncbi:MAG TPA: phospholipid carrier-dependent glycosyltransferase [Gemmatimonadaceae bacterium]|nr:phospholipid carrier-dependent glycosyltransferase [Gemmatimonadaceae bacterium]
MTRRNEKPAARARGKPAQSGESDSLAWADLLAGSKWKIPAALGILHLLIAILAFHPAPFSGGDDATYIALARSLIERHDYRDIWDPALPPQTLYPPIFPAIVAIGLLMGLGIAIGLKLMMVFLSSAAVFVSCLWLWRVAKPGVAIGAGVLVALSPEIIGIGREVLSDTPFWLFTMLALLALRKLAGAEKEGDEQHRAGAWKLELAASVAIVAAYFTRSAGLPLLLAAIIWLIVRRRGRAVAILLATSVPFIVLWWLHGRSNPGGGYLGPFLYIDPYVPSRGTIHFRDLLLRLQENGIKYRMYHVPRIVAGLGATSLAAGSVLTLLALFGWVMRLRRPSVVEIWTVFYLGLVLLWPPAWAAPRFLLAIIPVLALYAAESVAFLASFTPWPGFAGAAGIAVLVGVTAPGIRHHLSDGETCRGQFAEGVEFPCTEPIFRDFFLTAASVKGKLPPGSVVLSRKPTLFYLYSGYQSRLYPLTPVPDSLFAEAARIHARFVVIDQIMDLAPMYLHPVLLARRNDFCVVPEFSHAEAAFARIEIGGPPLAPGAGPNAFRVCHWNAVATNSVLGR